MVKSHERTYLRLCKWLSTVRRTGTHGTLMKSEPEKVRVASQHICNSMWSELYCAGDRN